MVIGYRLMVIGSGFKRLPQKITIVGSFEAIGGR